MNEWFNKRLERPLNYWLNHNNMAGGMLHLKKNTKNLFVIENMNAWMESKAIHINKLS